MHGAVAAEAAPALIEGNTPVQADDFCASLFHGRQQSRAVGGEINYGHTGFMQCLYQFRGARQRVLAIVFHAQAADPAIEDLNRIRAGTHLLDRIFGHHVDQLAHQDVPGFGGRVHQLFGVDVFARAAALDHVAGQGEGGATEADDREARSEMFGYQAHGFGNVSQIGGAIDAEANHIVLLTQRLLDDWAFSG